MRDIVDDERQSRQAAAARPAGSFPDGYLHRCAFVAMNHIAVAARLEYASFEKLGWSNNLLKVA